MSSPQSVFPVKDRVETDAAPDVVSIETADEMFDALTSSTARGMIARLYEDPATASELADAVDTSLQNAHYHLDRLREAGLVTVVDTWYSSKGREMKVYAPTADPLMIFAGKPENETALQEIVAD